MTDHEEVIINGDSTDEEEEVRIITPASRKRRRYSNIMMDQDEEDAEEEEKEKTEDQEKQQEKTTVALSCIPRRQQQLHLDKAGVSMQRMTLRTPLPVHRSRRNLQQLSISNAVARGDCGRHHKHDKDKESDNDDDVRIVKPPPASFKTNSGQKSRRFTIQECDEELGPAEKEQETQQNLETNIGNDDETSPASRRSSRIQHKRQEKELQHGIARKLAYPVLENCLNNLARFGPHCQDEDGENDSEDTQEFDLDKSVAPPAQKRRRSILLQGERDDREKIYADSGEDVDDFICGDNEIEYMEDDEEGAISVETPDDEIEDGPEEVTAMLAAGRSREMSEWFCIYLEYLEECIIDPDFETKMRRKRSKAKYQLYGQAVNRIERKLCSCRDAVQSGVAWPGEMMDALKCASFFRSSHVSAKQDCEACNRRQHFATYHVEFAGVAYDATKLYGHNWMRHLKAATLEAAPVQIAFKMGSVCHARTLAYWQLLHAKQFWCILVDAKVKECADCTGRIAEQYRNKFFTQEFGRYKRLVGLVDKFAEDSKRVNVSMPNVWKHITRCNMTSAFLPLPSHTSSLYTSTESRRGMLDAVVAESEEESTEDEEAEMEKREVKKQAVAGGINGDNESSIGKDEMKKGSPLRTPSSECKKEPNFQQTAIEDDKKGDDLVKDEKDIDDLMCLVCDASQRDAGVVHGLYLHVYCCYACAKRQYRMKSGCIVCNRPIDRVLRLLPLTLDARNAIRSQMPQN
ncbi:unnamed protein product [Peronospora belbahrii]|uniref:DUF4211 domain-containing protein n=1 Tax=Peronospora belbahrii TaxID=622444 RepID=A0ABN8CX59_9STRA|nr:unnamed protein product [Peronospora belbahrii]